MRYSLFPARSASDCVGSREKRCAFEDTFSECKLDPSALGHLRKESRGGAGPGGHGSFSGKRCVLGQKLCLLILLI